MCDVTGNPCQIYRIPGREGWKQPIRTRYLGHVTGYQPIRGQYFGHVISYQPIWDQGIEGSMCFEIDIFQGSDTIHNHSSWEWEREHFAGHQLLLKLTRKRSRS
eukprot:sb/3478080/